MPIVAKIIVPDTVGDTHMVWTPLWGSAVHHDPCPSSAEVSPTAVVQTMDRECKGQLEQGRRKWGRKCTATLQFPKLSLPKGEAEICL